MVINMVQYKSLRDRCRYRNWDCLKNRSHDVDPIWWNYIPRYGMLEKAGNAVPPVYFKGIKSIMEDARSDSLKLDVVYGHTSITKYDMKLSNNRTNDYSTLKNKIYELVCINDEVD